jgi:hypothetical protein
MRRSLGKALCVALVALTASPAFATYVKQPAPVVNRFRTASSHLVRRLSTPRRLDSVSSARALQLHVIERALAVQAQAGQPVVYFGFGGAGDPAVPIVDLNHDRAQEVLQARLSMDRPVVQVSSGKTGVLLWTFRTPGLAGAEFASSGSKGGLVLVYSAPEDDVNASAGGDGGRSPFVVTALDARTGSSLWSHEWQGAYALSPVGGAITTAEADGLLSTRGQPAAVLIDTVTIADSAAVGATELQPSLVDVRTGATLVLGHPTINYGDAFDEAVTDLNGDGVDDVVSVSDGDTATVTAWSGSSGKPLWTYTEPQGSITFVQSTPDVSGDHVADLIVGASFSMTNMVTALAGTTGKPMWSQPGEVAFPAGGDTRTGTRATIVADLNHKLRVTDVSPRGAVRWARDLPATIKGATATVYAAGDLNHDGYQDIYVRYLDATALLGEAVAATAAVLIDGSTGAVHHTADLGMPVLQPLVGDTDSFIGLLRTSNGCVITGYDGATGHLLWRRRIEVRTSDVASVAAARLGPRATRGLIVAITGPLTEYVIAAGGATGQVEWQQSYPISKG